MKELLENDSGLEVKATEAPAISVGKTLREAREGLGLTVADVSAHTKIVARQIEALEADDFQSLPEMAFVRGFVRSYARMVQLDAQLLLAALPQPVMASAQLLPASVDVPFSSGNPLQLQNLLWLGGALLLVLPLVLYAVWHYTTPPQQPPESGIGMPLALPAKTQLEPASAVADVGAMAASSPLAESTMTTAATATTATTATAATAADTVPMETPAGTVVQEIEIPAVAAAASAVAAPPPPVAQISEPAQSAPVAVLAMKPLPQAAPPVQAVPSPTPMQSAESAVPAQASTLQLVFDEESWTEIRDHSDRILSSKLHAGGSELRLGGSAPFSLVIGHAKAVQLYFRGRQVDLKPYTNVYSEVAHVTLQ